MSNRPRTGVVHSVLVKGTLAALLAMTLGCGASSPAAPTPTPVTAAPAAPAPVRPQSVYTVTADSNTAAPGGPLNVSWTASTGQLKDWIGLFKVGAWNGDHGWSSYTDGATSGTFTLSAPTQAGQYEFRYLLNNGVDDAARSSVVTVGAGL
jgi:hypothetical protein